MAKGGNIDEKLDERRTLNIFQEIYQLFPLGVIKDNESPDFLLHTKDGIIGIEITEVFQDSYLGPSKLQQYSAEAEGFSEQLLQELKQSVTYPISIGICFSKDYPIAKAQRNFFIEQAKSICLPALLNLQDGKHICLEYQDGLPEQFDRIHLHRWDKLEESFNSKPEGGPVGYLKLESIKPLLLRKESKLKKYTSCTKQWLLIKEGNYYAGSFSDVLIETPIESSFDKVFLVREGKKEVFELK